MRRSATGALDGYRHTVEHSVYVHQAHRGEGIGKALLIALIARAREIGKHVMVAGIESGNQASIQLHRRSSSARWGAWSRWAPNLANGWI